MAVFLVWLGTACWISVVTRSADFWRRHADPAILGQTRQYLLDAQRLLGQRPTPREFFDQMVAEHPARLNPGPVW